MHFSTQGSAMDFNCIISSWSYPAFLFSKKSGWRTLVWTEILKNIEKAPLNQATDCLHRFTIHNGSNTGCPEFVGNARCHNQLDARTDAVRVDSLFHEQGIKGRIRLDIHGDVVHEPLFDEVPDHLGMAAVGVELYGIAFSLNAA